VVGKVREPVPVGVVIDSLLTCSTAIFRFPHALAP
jgi:hypothetical protein